jgi:aspartate aminotransferase
LKACEKAIESGQTKYVTVSGILPLRKAICKKLKEDNNVDYQPKEIIVSTGAKQALYNALLYVYLTQTLSRTCGVPLELISMSET